MLKITIQADGIKFIHNMTEIEAEAAQRFMEVLCREGRGAPRVGQSALLHQCQRDVPWMCLMLLPSYLTAALKSWTPRFSPPS